MNNCVDETSDNLEEIQDNYSLRNYLNFPYSDYQQVKKIQTILQNFNTPLTVKDIISFDKEIHDVLLNKAFILHGGDCVELFQNCHNDYIKKQMDLLNYGATQLELGLAKKICCIARHGGQYAKPRTSYIQKIAPNEHYNYFGDIINNFEYTKNARMPDPERMLLGYCYTLENQRIMNDLQKNYNRKIYTSHEALLLPYETAMTRAHHKSVYNLSCHFPWIGMRTAYLDSAHINYIKKIENPIAIKLGPDMSEEQLLQLVQYLKNKNLPGRLCIIYRFGVNKVREKLMKVLSSFKNEQIIFICDPMHGNTKTHADGQKVRNFNEITEEMLMAVKIHLDMGVPLNGIHVEVSAEAVDECLNTNDNNNRTYKSKVDPRLNTSQFNELIRALINELNTHTLF